MMPDQLLKIDKLNVYHGSSHTLQDIDINIFNKPKAILGRNGMGKTTLCSALMGLTKAASGAVLLDQTDISSYSPESRAKTGIGYVPQGRRIFRSLSVIEHLKLVEKKDSQWSIEKIFSIFPRLAERRNNMGDRLSGGEQQMLAISRALMLDPKIMIMDEPTEGLAPTIVDDVVELLHSLAEHEIGLLLVEQNISVALEVASDILIMLNGRIVDQVTAEELKGNTQMQQKYLGINFA
ncbi:ABC transporter ATP-binding protein ['Osedax' symbiont bacterium Rs2_46_30_T18]|nr:ABC transporter ATP-binding protein ['Osedax' symbiont bacterium Rs2_46_30_T18]